MEKTHDDGHVTIKEEVSSINFHPLCIEEPSTVEVINLPYHNVGSEAVPDIQSSSTLISIENKENCTEGISHPCMEPPTFYEMINLPCYPTPSQSVNICGGNSLPEPLAIAESVPGPSFSAESGSRHSFSAKNGEDKLELVENTSQQPIVNIKYIDHFRPDNCSPNIANVARDESTSKEFDFDSIFVEVDEEEELYSEDEYGDDNYFGNLHEQTFPQRKNSETGEESQDQLDGVQSHQAGVNDLNLLLENDVPWDYFNNVIRPMPERVNSFSLHTLRGFQKQIEIEVAFLDAHMEVVENILNERRGNGVTKKLVLAPRLGLPYFGNSDDFPKNEDWKTITALGHRMTYEIKMDRNLSPLDINLVYTEVRNYLRDACVASTIPELEEIFDKGLKPNEEYLRTLRAKGVFDAIDKIGNDVHWVTISKTTAKSIPKSTRFTPHTCRGVWEYLVKPTINQDPWSELEDQRLLELAEEHNYENWDEIASELDTFRNGYGCCVRYNKFLRKMEAVKFTKAEDERLLRSIKQFSVAGQNQWRAVCHMFPNRSRLQLMCRYTRLKERSMGVKKGKVKMGKFSEREKEMIDRLGAMGMSHLEIANHVPTRTATQIREYMALRELRESNNLSGSWTMDEVGKLMKLVEEHGTNWKLIAKLHGRNRQQCRIKYLRCAKAWAREEIAKLEEGARLYPKNWEKIANHVGTRNANECLYAFGHMKFSSRKRGPLWSPLQIERLLTLIAQYGLDWVVISEELGDFKASACSKKYSQILKKCRTWSDEMTDNLLKAVELYGEDWIKVSEEVGEYEELECKIKYLLLRASQHLVKPYHRRRKNLDSANFPDDSSLTKAADERNDSIGICVNSETSSQTQKTRMLSTSETKRLLKLVSESGGTDWVKIAANFEGRLINHNACFKKYLLLVSTYENILKDKNAELIDAVEKYDESWSEVSKVMGVSELDCEIKYLIIRAEEARESHLQPTRKWNDSEVESLLNLVIRYPSSNWKQISEGLNGGRRPRSCKSKYRTLVNAYKNILENKESKLIEAVEKYGPDWSQVSDVLGESMLNCKVKYLLIRANEATMSHLKSNEISISNVSDSLSVDNSQYENPNELDTSSVQTKTQEAFKLNAASPLSKLNSLRSKKNSDNKSEKHFSVQNNDLPVADSQINTRSLNLRKKRNLRNQIDEPPSNLPKEKVKIKLSEPSSMLPKKRKTKNQIDEPSSTLPKKSKTEIQIVEPTSNLLKKRNSKNKIDDPSPNLPKKNNSRKRKCNVNDSIRIER